MTTKAKTKKDGTQKLLKKARETIAARIETLESPQAGTVEELAADAQTSPASGGGPAFVAAPETDTAAEPAGVGGTQTQENDDVKTKKHAKKTAADPKPKRERKAKAPKEPKPKKTSALDAAAQVLARAKNPMRCKELVEQMESKGLWKSPGGKTPEATLYSAILREITTKGKESRFKKADRGQFAAA